MHIRGLFLEALLQMKREALYSILEAKDTYTIPEVITNYKRLAEKKYEDAVFEKFI
jgi:hypothetical protein